MRISALFLRAAIAAAPVLTFSAVRAETTPTTWISPASASTAVPATRTDSAYELGGFFGSGDKLEVSLKKRGESESKWVRVGKKTGDLLVESADSTKGTAIVNISGVRYRLTLRGENATPLPDKLSGTATFTSSASLATVPVRRNESPEMKAKRERFEAIMGNLTPEQHQRIGSALAKTMRDALEKNPELAKGGDQQGMQRLAREAFGDGIREALQMPGKDGKTAVVPADFNELFDAGTAGNGAGAVVSVGRPMVIDPNGKRMRIGAPESGTDAGPVVMSTRVISSGDAGTLILTSDGPTPSEPESAPTK